MSSFRKDPQLHRRAESGGLSLLPRLELVEAAEEEEVGDLLDHLQRVGNAARSTFERILPLSIEVRWVGEVSAMSGRIQPSTTYCNYSRCRCTPLIGNASLSAAAAGESTRLRSAASRPAVASPAAGTGSSATGELRRWWLVSLRLRRFSLTSVDAPGLLSRSEVVPATLQGRIQ